MSSPHDRQPGDHRARRETVRTVFLKLGGSLITDKSREGVFRDRVVRRLAQEIRSAMDEEPMRLIVGHGGGSFAHRVAKQYAVARGLSGGGGWRGYVLTRRAVIDLNGRVLDAFADQDFYPVAVPPSATAVARGGKLVRMDLTVITKLLDAGQVPMICGDAVIDEEQGFAIASTEALFAHLAQHLDPRRVVIACDVDGVFDRDPNTDDDARRLGKIDSANLEQVLNKLTEGAGPDVTGGMAGKVKAVHDLAWQCFESEIRIVGGLAADRVREALEGRGGGTRVQA